MITNFQISDFAKRRTEAIEIASGRELTGQERSQCRAFFNALGSDFQRSKILGRKWDSKSFWNLNAPEIVKELSEKSYAIFSSP